jgi:ABC-type Fe3+/spermidine/putrescine transport system ATPase subunit
VLNFYEVYFILCKIVTINHLKEIIYRSKILIKIKIKKPLFGVVENMVLDVDLEIKKGEFVAIKGKSGSGKTTFLRVLAGLEEAEGEIKVNG